MTIKNFFHFGISVKDVELASGFFERVFGFRVVQERVIDSPYIFDLVGEEGVSAKVRMLEIEDGSYLEILEWSSAAVHPLSNCKDSIKITDFSAQHLCLYVDDALTVHGQLKLEGEVEFLANEITVISQGPNKGAKVFFIRVFGFLYLELFQKPSL